MSDGVVQGLGFLGVRLENRDAFEATVSLYRDTLGLTPFREEPGRLAWFRLGDGTELHVYGVEFLWETQRDDTRSWAHYRGPDGTVYELIGPVTGTGR